jgi:hypothetical protein
MKRGYRVSVLCITAALLSGCATQTPLEDNVRLLEYEKCLDFYIQSAIKGNFRGSSGGSDMEPQKENQNAFRFWVLELCETRRP